MTGPLVIAVWGVILFVLWIVYWTIFQPDTEGSALLASAVLVTWLMALWAGLRERRLPAPADREPEAVPDTSRPAALFGIAVAAAALSTEFGPWLAYGAIVLLAFSVGGLIREWRGQRADLREVERERGRSPGVSGEVSG